MSEANNTHSEGSGQQQSSQAANGQWAAVKNKLAENHVNTGLWVIRLVTIFFCLAYIFPVFGNQLSHYHKALLGNAATSALRLHQRLPPFQFSREFFARMFVEDSCHYLFYSIIFMNVYPITMALIPVFLFAVLHSSSFTLTLITLLGQSESWAGRKLTTLVQQHQQNILRIIACTEIFLMPTIIFLAFTGRASILLPFVYYRFLSLRYTSQRNPYSRTMFYELRLSTEVLVYKPQCPAFIRNIVLKLIGFISRLAPQTATAPPTQSQTQ